MLRREPRTMGNLTPESKCGCGLPGLHVKPQDVTAPSDFIEKYVSHLEFLDRVARGVAKSLRGAPQVKAGG